MYISCTSLWDAGITKEKVSCCGSCHEDADSWPGDYPLIEIYPEEIGLPRDGELVGSICCSVHHFLNDLGDKRELFLSIYEREDNA